MINENKRIIANECTFCFKNRWYGCDVLTGVHMWQTACMHAHPTDWMNTHNTTKKMANEFERTSEWANGLDVSNGIDPLGGFVYYFKNRNIKHIWIFCMKILCVVRERIPSERKRYLHACMHAEQNIAELLGWQHVANDTAS